MLYSRSNETILKELDKVVYGHKAAKMALITLVNRSKMRYHQIWHAETPVAHDDLVKNVNCLLIGNSGTGKTHLVQSLAKICDFPLVCIDANQLAPTNASDGFSVDRLIKTLKKEASRLVEEKPEIYFSKDGALDQMVVFIDEVDKLAKAFDSSGSWNQHVQAGFLSLFENTTELANLSFVFAGAFDKMTLSKESDKRSIGFKTEIHEVDNEFDLEQEVIKYGLLPELVGRIHNIVPLDKLEKDDYKKILRTLILPNMRKELKHFNCPNFTLSVKEEEGIINKAVKSKMGVRVLRKEVLKLAQEIEFDYEWEVVAQKPKPKSRIFEADFNDLIANKKD